MKITERITSVRNHTIGFVINKREYTRFQAIRMAKNNQIQDVKVVRASYGDYLMGTINSLYSLPTRTPRSNTLNRLRSH